MFTAGVLTVSDKGSRGERVDESGQVIKEALVSLGASEIKYGIVPDERPAISAKLREWSDAGVDLVLTTGGTGSDSPGRDAGSHTGCVGQGSSRLRRGHAGIWYEADSAGHAQSGRGRHTEEDIDH